MYILAVMPLHLHVLLLPAADKQIGRMQQHQQMIAYTCKP